MFGIGKQFNLWYAAQQGSTFWVFLTGVIAPLVLFGALFGLPGQAFWLVVMGLIKMEII